MEYLKHFQKQCENEEIIYAQQFRWLQEHKSRLLCDEYWAYLPEKVQEEVYEILKSLQNKVVKENWEKHFIDLTK